VVAAVAAIVALLAARPWDDGGYKGSRPIPDRAGMKDCGLFVRDVKSGGISASGWSCFTTAMAGGRPAELRFIRFTTEGDPTFTTYTTAGNGTATVLTDSRLDHFAGMGSRLLAETCRRPETRPVARGMFLDCRGATSVDKPLPVADAFCGFVLDRPVIGAQITTLAAVRKTNVGGPYPGLRPGKDMFLTRPGAMRASWCWTEEAEGTGGGSPGPTWTLYVALATGESARFIGTNAGTRPPSGPPSFP